MAIAVVREPIPIVAVSTAGALLGSYLSDRQRPRSSDSAIGAFAIALASVERKLAEVETKLTHLPMSGATRRTAIFYDIENLIKGYNIKSADVAKISLKSIQEQITAVYPIERVLLQRAYANWSDARLGSLRREMHQLGIEPVQVFGFSYENRKNAAGKSCQAICDAFVHILGPTVKPRPTMSLGSDTPLAPEAPQPPAFEAPPLDPDNRRLCCDLSGSSTHQAAAAIAKTRDILEWYRRDPHCAAILRQEGLAMSKVQEAVQILLPHFYILQLGMVKFSEYLRYVCKNTVFCVFHLQGNANQLKLGLRKSLPTGAIPMANSEKRPLHSLATYRALLAQQRCTLAIPGAFAEVLPWLLQHREVAAQLAELAALFSQTTATKLAPNQVEIALANCQQADILVPTPEGGDRYFVAASLTNEVECQESLRQWLSQILQPHLQSLQEQPKPELLDALLQPK